MSIYGRLGGVAASAATNYNLGTFAGLPLPDSINNSGIGMTWGTTNALVQTTMIDTGVLRLWSVTAAGSSLVFTHTYSVPASGSVNPADSKTMLVDNDNPDLGSVFDNLGLKMITDTSVTITQLGTDQPAGTIRAYGFPKDTLI